MAVRHLIGACVFDKAWAIQPWINSLMENCDPADTGIALVLHPDDHRTRQIVMEVAHLFAWVEFVKYEHDRKRGPTSEDGAKARTRLLNLATTVGPEYLILWDVDYLFAPRTLTKVAPAPNEVACFWAWTNRGPAQRRRDLIGGEYVEYEFEPVEGSAMKLTRLPDGERAITHFPPAEFRDRRDIDFPCDFAIGPLVMTEHVYRGSRFLASKLGEYAPFALLNRKRGVRFLCHGQLPMVRLSGTMQDDQLLIEHDFWDAFWRMFNQVPRISRPDPFDARPEHLKAIGVYPVDSERTT